MKLAEHPDFDQAVMLAAEHFRSDGLRPSLVEKDYFVTDVLRSLAAQLGDKILFKGGTSLSKGWGLIHRFSEDIDLFLDPEAFQPTLGKNGIDREAKRIRDLVSKRWGLSHIPEESRTIGGFGRSDRFAFPQKFAGVGDVGGHILLEVGSASGREPIETRRLQSFIGQFLAETGRTLGADDEAPFPMRLLHFRRTFVEKLFAIHSKVEITKGGGTTLGSHARHYYDLYQLAGTREVLAMLQADEYIAIRNDYDRISRSHFARDYFAPLGLSFRNSDAVFPNSALSTNLREAYEAQCRLLCFGDFPSWNQVVARFEEIRQLL